MSDEIRDDETIPTDWFIKHVYGKHDYDQAASESFHPNLMTPLVIVGEPSLLERSFEMLQYAAGHYAAAAYSEGTSPPYKLGKAYEQYDKILSLLADLQKELKK